jgi:hypothetical protein
MPSGGARHTVSIWRSTALYDKPRSVFHHDIALVASIMNVPSVLDVNPSLPVKSVPEFLGYAKARLADLGGTVLTGSPADFGKPIADETQKWAKVIRANSNKAE